jgi:phasin family protein
MENPRQEDKSTQNVEDTAGRTSERTAEQTSRVGQAAAEQTTRVGEAAAEQTSRVGQAAAKAGEEVARAGAHLLQQNAETLQNAWRSGLDMATAAMGRSTDQLGRTLGFSGNETQQATERSARNAETVLYTSTAAAKLMDGMSREYFEFVRRQIENSTARINDLWRCKTPQDLAAVQSDLVREAMESALESSRRIADISLKMADDAAKHMAQNMERPAA